MNPKLMNRVQGKDLALKVSKNVKAEMARNGITQEQLAKGLGRHQTAVSQRLRGVAEWKISELPAIADILGVSIADLLGIEEKPGGGGDLARLLSLLPQMDSNHQPFD